MFVHLFLLEINEEEEEERGLLRRKNDGPVVRRLVVKFWVLTLNLKHLLVLFYEYEAAF